MLFSAHFVQHQYWVNFQITGADIFLYTILAFNSIHLMLLKQNGKWKMEQHIFPNTKDGKLNISILD